MKTHTVKYDYDTKCGVGPIEIRCYVGSAAREVEYLRYANECLKKDIKTERERNKVLVDENEKMLTRVLRGQSLWRALKDFAEVYEK